ncbi:MAG: ribonuclease HI family protein [Candidatus Ratteibacteria bacterium]|nr:ribonuclease HI family protein [Candidatus Ratteibacteria bacterium]
MTGYKELVIYIDGASKGNPGQAGIGAVIKDSRKNVIKRLSKGIGLATNNVAEYYACIYALQEALILRAEVLTVYTDSQLLVNQLKGNFKVKSSNLKPLHTQVLYLLKGFKKIYLRHINREENKEADKLANQALQPVPSNLE